MSVLTDLKSRGVEDILITVTDNLNGKIRKYTKTKMSFPTDALRESVWLSLQEIEKKWTISIKNWGLVMNQFMLILNKSGFVSAKKLSTLIVFALNLH